MNLTPKHKDLLMQIEAICVDSGGLFNSDQLSQDDLDILKSWNKTKFLQYGLISSSDIDFKQTATFSHWVELAQEAWQLAHQYRHEKSKNLKQISNVKRLGFQNLINFGEV